LFIVLYQCGISCKGGVPLGTGFGAETLGAWECLGSAFPLAKLALQNKLVAPYDTIFNEKQDGGKQILYLDRIL